MLKTKIEIIDLHYPVRIGCTEEERSRPQDIAFDVVIHFNALASCKSDDLAQTIDYISVSQLIHQMTETRVFSLIEKFAWTCVEEMFNKFPAAEKIDFKIRKFSTMPNSSHVGFSIEASR